MRWREIALIVFISLAASSCGSNGQKTSDFSSTVQPTTSDAPELVLGTPSPTARKNASSIPQCGSPDLIAVFSGTHAATNGQMLSNIRLVNRSDANCALSGTPDVLFYDVNGEVVPMPNRVRKLCDDGGCGSTVLAPGAQVSSGSVHGTARLSIMWATHDGAGFCDPPPPVVTRVGVMLPDGGEIDVTTPDSREPFELRPCGGWMSILPIVASDA